MSTNIRDVLNRHRARGGDIASCKIANVEQCRGLKCGFAMSAQTRFAEQGHASRIRLGAQRAHGAAGHSLSSGATELSDLRTALPPINSVISRLCQAKRKYGFDFDDIMIIAACGAINFAGAKQQMPFAQPANITSIAGYIRVPRETVRRKLQYTKARASCSVIPVVIWSKASTTGSPWSTCWPRKRPPPAILRPHPPARLPRHVAAWPHACAAGTGSSAG